MLFCTMVQPRAERDKEPEQRLDRNVRHHQSLAKKKKKILLEAQHQNRAGSCFAVKCTIRRITRWDYQGCCISKAILKASKQKQKGGLAPSDRITEYQLNMGRQISLNLFNLTTEQTAEALLWFTNYLRSLTLFWTEKPIQN